MPTVSAQRARFVGGPRDGEYTDIIGPVYYEPIPRGVRYQPQESIPSPSDGPKIRAYDLWRTDDGEYVYVARPV